MNVFSKHESNNLTYNIIDRSCVVYVGISASLAIYLNSFPKSHFLGTTTQNGEVSSDLHNLIIDVVCYYLFVSHEKHITFNLAYKLPSMASTISVGEDVFSLLRPI
jgi:hypothetical protein